MVYLEVTRVVPLHPRNTLARRRCQRARVDPPRSPRATNEHQAQVSQAPCGKSGIQCMPLLKKFFIQVNNYFTEISRNHSKNSQFVYWSFVVLQGL